MEKSTKKWSCYIKNENTLYRNILQHLRHLEEQFKCTLSLEIQHPSIQYIAQCVHWDKGIHVVLVCGTVATLLTDCVVCVSDLIGKYNSKQCILWTYRLSGKYKNSSLFCAICLICFRIQLFCWIGSEISDFFGLYSTGLLCKHRSFKTLAKESYTLDPKICVHTCHTSTTRYFEHIDMV